MKQSLPTQSICIIIWSLSLSPLWKALCFWKQNFNYCTCSSLSLRLPPSVFVYSMREDAHVRALQMKASVSKASHSNSVVSRVFCVHFQVKVFVPQTQKLPTNFNSFVWSTYKYINVIKEMLKFYSRVRNILYNSLKFVWWYALKIYLLDLLDLIYKTIFWSVKHATCCSLVVYEISLRTSFFLFYCYS